MWEYTFETNDKARDFASCLSDWLSFCGREGKTVLTTCTPEEAETYSGRYAIPEWMPQPTSYAKVQIAREDLVVALGRARELAHGMESAHVLADMWLLAYIDDPEVTAAFESIPRWYS